MNTPPGRDPRIASDYRFHSNGTACEWGESYHPGGYCPVHIKDIFYERYHILRKLGYGSYSTVWLARDLSTSLPVALKVHTADFDPDHTELELRIHTILKVDRAYEEHFATLLNSFHHEGPNGVHLCLVYEVMGPNLTTVIQRYPRCRVGEAWDRRLPKDWARKFLRGTLLALQLLHTNGIIHGDIQPNNILLTLQPSFRGLKSLESLIQNPDKENFLERLDGEADKWAPKYLLAPQPLCDPSSPEPLPRAKLGDLGGAILSTSTPTVMVTPAALRAPEAILNAQINTAIDVWGFGCLMFELITNTQLFRVESMNGDRYDETYNDEHLLQIIETLQPLPEALFSQWPRAMEYYGPDGKLLDKYVTAEHSDDTSVRELDGIEHSVETSSDYNPDADRADDVLSEVPLAFFERLGSLEERFKAVKPEDIDEQEEEKIIRVLRLALQTDAAVRPSAAELLEEAWFQS